MLDDNAPAAPAEVAPGPTITEHVPPPQGDDNHGLDTQEQSDAPQLSDEDYALNFLGSDKFELPRETPEEIRAALKNLEKSLNKGWTEKNQSFAEQRRQFLEQQQARQAELAAAQALEDDRLEVRALQKQLEAYDKLAPTDWDQWATNDPAAAQRAFMQFQALKGQVERKQAEVSAKQTQAMMQQQQQAAAWLERASQQLSTEIPGWGAEKAQSVAKFVQEQYLNTNTPMDQTAFQALNFHPGLVRMANEAMLYRQSLQRAKTPVPAPVVPPQPVAKAGSGSAPAAKSPEKMSDAEWIAAREKELAFKARAARR
jgi:hypothetical protein